MCTHKIVHIIRIPVSTIISSKRARSTFEIPKESEVKEVQGICQIFQYSPGLNSDLASTTILKRCITNLFTLKTQNSINRASKSLLGNV
jgi:hypothetical protein